MIDMGKIGERIAVLRKERGFTGEALAERLHVSPQAVSKWENAKCLPEKVPEKPWGTTQKLSFRDRPLHMSMIPLVSLTLRLKVLRISATYFLIPHCVPVHSDGYRSQSGRCGLAGQAAFSTSLGVIVIPPAFSPNLLLVFLGLTRTLNVDVWNPWQAAALWSGVSPIIC